MSGFEIQESLFTKNVKNLKSNQKNQIFNITEYQNFLHKIEEIKTKLTKKTPIEYQWVLPYDVLKISEIKRLIVSIKNTNDKITYYSYIEEKCFFDPCKSLSF